MATRRNIPLNKIEGVTAGGTAIIDLPLNVRYHAIFLEYHTTTSGGATLANVLAEIKEIRILIDEVVQRRMTSKELYDINRTKGIIPRVGNATTPAYLPLFFSEPQRKTQIMQEATAWGMAGVEDFQIEIDLIDNGQTPKLKGFATVDDTQEAPAGIIKWKRNKLTVAGTGEISDKLNTVNGDSHQALYLFEQNDGDIEDMLLEWDGIKVAQFTKAQQSVYIDHFVNNAVEVDALIHLPLDANNPADALRSVKNVNGQLRQVQEIIYTLNMAAATDVTIIRELVGTPD